MNRLEFERKWLSRGDGRRDERIKDLTALLEASTKEAKIDGLRVALNLHAQYPGSFREVMTSLIEAKPPEIVP